MQAYYLYCKVLNKLTYFVIQFRLHNFNFNSLYLKKIGHFQDFYNTQNIKNKSPTEFKLETKINFKLLVYKLYIIQAIRIVIKSLLNMTSFLSVINSHHLVLSEFCMSQKDINRNCVFRELGICYFVALQRFLILHRY